MKASRRFISITGMRDIVQRRVPVLSLRSDRPGPAVWLAACIHGDEVGGAVIVHDVFRAVRECGLRRGTLNALPLINSMGFENVSRFINADREDLNRCFPGDPRGSMGEQIARRLFDTIARSEPDLAIDLHNDWSQSVPYLLLEPPAYHASEQARLRAMALARATGLLLVQDTDNAPEMCRTLAAALAAAGIPAFTIEAGGAYSVIEECVLAGKEAILSVLHHLSMIPRPVVSVPQPAERQLLSYTNRPLCSTSGLIRFSVAPGERVKRNQILARVYSAFGSCEETLRATGPGVVLGLADHARVVPGSEVIAVARRED